jgi:hypothetical protein
MPYPTLIASPVKVPETFFVAGAAVVFVAAGVGDAAADFVAAGVGSVVFVEVAFALLVATDVFVVVALLVAAGAGAVVVAGAASVVEPTGAMPPPRVAVLSEDVNCGGVMARTAPRPPTVPPAINSARFISLLSLSYL